MLVLTSTWGVPPKQTREDMCGFWLECRISINKAFLPGPNLINQTVGVLLKFWEEQLAGTGDLEKFIFKSKGQKIIDTFCSSCGGRRVTSAKFLLIMKWQLIYLVAYHYHAQVLFLKNQSLQIIITLLFYHVFHYLLLFPFFDNSSLLFWSVCFHFYLFWENNKNYNKLRFLGCKSSYHYHIKN